MSSSDPFSAQPTDTNGPSRTQQSTPPLLPAFLITGLLLAAIVFIIVWRHLIDRRALREEDDPTWPIDGIGGGGINTPTPKLWELHFSSESARALWADIMPLSAVPLRGKGKPCLPRYLVPSDRPVSFFTRMFGGERREGPPPPLPPISILPQTQHLPVTHPPEEDEEDEPIEQLQVAVLIALPHPHCGRRQSYLLEKQDSSLQTIAECSDTEEPDPPISPDKGKKRSLEIPAFVTKAYDDEDEDGPLEVAFGTVTLPFTADIPQCSIELANPS